METATSNTKRAQLTQAELAQLLAGMDVNGVLITLSPEANEIIERLHTRLTSTRKPRVCLRRPEVMQHYKGLMIAELDANMQEVAMGGELIGETVLSVKIGLSDATIINNKTLHAIYERYRHTVCNLRPATVNNDF